MYSVLNDFPLCAPSCEMGLDEDDESVSWLNFPIAEPLNDECYSEFLPELGNESSKQKSSSHHVKELVHPSSAVNAMSILQDSTSKVISGVTELKKHKTGDNSPLVWSQHLLLTGNSEITRSDSGNNLMDPRNSGDSFMGSKLNKLNAGQPMNFPYFSFASIPGATIAGAVTNGKQREFNKNRGGTINGHNPMEPILINSSHQEADFLPPQESEAVCVKAGEDDISLDQPFDAVPPKIMVGVERIPEPAVTTSSVCSGNNRFERNSNDPACSLKRKCHETADSDSSNNEAEEESFSDGQNAFGCTDSKRSRVAKVHSLSERRRRERINEKMRALQELMPNYSTADKASMLDEAIEYLKALQLQVQLLSMGSGMYMHPMMLPAAMQRMHRNHMPHLLPMGMGLGSAMSMQNLNYSMTQMPNIQGQQPFMSSMPCVPPPLCGSSPMGNISTMPGMFAVPLLAPSATPKEMMVQNVSSQMTNQNAQ